MGRLSVILSMCLVIGSCNPRLPSEPDLFVDFEMFDSPTTPLSDTAKSSMNGVYNVVEGEDLFGNPLVGKWIGKRWCLFSHHDVVYSETAGGSSGDSIKLSGYLRNIRSASGGRLRLKVLSNEGAKEIMSGQIPSSTVIRGTIEGGRTIELRRVRNLNTSPFQVLAHRGGGRNSDRLGISENSIEMIRFASTLGATGVEIDVQRTRDNELIVFHDDTFSPRTVQGIYLLGKVENFDLRQIQLLGRLIYGEKIPTLSEALRAVINETNLSLVWLDVKDPRTVTQIVQIQKAAMDTAAAKGRTVTILLGIPSDEVLQAYKDQKDYTTDILVELEVGTALSFNNCRVWAPIWTREVTTEDIILMKSRNKSVFIWTVDLHESIVDFMDKNVQGILSNYPTLVTAVHDSRN